MTPKRPKLFSNVPESENILVSGYRGPNCEEGRHTKQQNGDKDHMSQPQKSEEEDDFPILDPPRGRKNMAQKLLCRNNERSIELQLDCDMQQVQR